MADKEYVLSEIRRTAKANGGLPLGSKRFTDETGIRDIDWRGKYWARWGDALVEAGFSPNQFQGAYPDEFLLEKLAALTLELGHFPVVTEMKMKAHRDPDFPNPKTIRRLGGRNQLMASSVSFHKVIQSMKLLAGFARRLRSNNRNPHRNRLSTSESAARFISSSLASTTSRQNERGRSSGV